MTAAARMRKHRQRARDGRATVAVEIDEAAVFEMLRLGGFIGDQDADDRAALARGLSRAIEALALRVTTQGEEIG